MYSIPETEISGFLLLSTDLILDRFSFMLFSTVLIQDRFSIIVTAALLPASQIKSCMLMPGTAQMKSRMLMPGASQGLPGP